MMKRRDFLALAGASPLMAQLKPPKPAPELTIILNSGEHLLLSRFRGKVVVLEFLLTTCPHCATCSSIMQKLHSELGDKFQPLGTAINPNSLTEARMLVPAYVSNLGLKFPVGYTPREQAYTWLEAQNSNAPMYFPQVVFIDKKGIIRHYFPGGDDFFKNEEANMRRLILELAAENAAGASKSGGRKS